MPKIKNTRKMMIFLLHPDGKELMLFKGITFISLCSRLFKILPILDVKWIVRWIFYCNNIYFYYFFVQKFY
jgi:hypothetical protein